MVAQHQQTWKLREYHLAAPDISSSDSGVDLGLDRNISALPPGEPLRSYFPNGTHIKEDREGLNVLVPNRGGSMRYQRASRVSSHSPKRTDGSRVVDIIVMGEVTLFFYSKTPISADHWLQGHSSWGQFNLIGRVRPCDGFISLSKEYVRIGGFVALLGLTVLR